MVTYNNIALCALMALSLSSSSSPFCDAFSNSQIGTIQRPSETFQLYVSVSSPLDDGSNKHSLQDAVESLGETLSEAVIREEIENHRGEEQLELKKQQVRQRQQTLDTLSRCNWLVQISLTDRIGMTVAMPIDMDGNVWRLMDLDTLQCYNQKMESFLPSDTSLDASSLRQSLLSDDKTGKIIVVSMDSKGQGWSNGIRPGDVVLASSATVGDYIWPKTTLEGLKSSISSRKIVSSEMTLQMARSIISDAPVLDNTFELTLTRPIGLDIEEDSNGYVVVTAFNENAGNLVRKGVQLGDRIVAVGSSFGDTLWPVSTVAGVTSACTARLPGQKVTMRFERPLENLISDKNTKTNLPTTPASWVETPTVSKQSAQSLLPPEQLNQLLQRCREVLKRYWSDSRTDFVGKHDIPVLVADKVVDAVASVSGSFDAVTLSMVMNSYISCRKPDSAIRVFQAATGYRADGSTDTNNVQISGKEKGTLLPDPSSLNLYTASSVMKAFAILGNFSAAKRILAAMEGKGGEIVESKVVAHWPGAGIPGMLKPDTICYNIVLSAGSASDDGVNDALSIFASMQPASASKQKGEIPSRDIISYNTIIAALDKEGRSDEAFEAFNEMRQAFIKPDKYTYTSLVNSCSKPLDMLELLYDMKEIGVKPDIVTYNTMIRTLCDRSQWYEAKKMIAEMESSGVLPNSLTYGFLMTGLMKAEKYNSCLSLFESACSDPSTMPLTENVHLYTTAISAAASMKNYEKAFDLMNRMKAAGVRPNIKTTTALMGACLAANMTNLAVEIYKQINQPDDIAMCKGLEAMSREGMHNEVAMTLYEQWRKRGSVLSGKQIMKLYVTLIQHALLQGNISSARHVFQQFLQCGFIPSKSMYRIMIESLGLIPPKRRDAPFAKEIPVEKFNFLLFVLDCIRTRNLSCDSEFYSTTLITSSRMGPLRRKIGSLLVEARYKEDSLDQMKPMKDDRNKEGFEGSEEKRTIGWEELLLNYDEYKQSMEIHQLPSLAVRVNTDQMRLVLNAEQSVLHKSGKSMSRTITNSKQRISLDR